MTEYTEYVGYLASFFVLLSFLMKKMMTLRIVSIIGCLFFIFYGALLGSIPVIITNASIVVVNAWFIFKMMREKEG